MAHRLVFTEGIWDLLHANHVDLIEEVASFGDRLLVGVGSDAMALRYKRRPIMSETERLRLVRALRVVSEAVLLDGPLDDGTVIQDIIDRYDPSLVCYAGPGYDAFYQPAIDRGIFRRLERRPGVSTSDLIERVLSRSAADMPNQVSGDRHSRSGDT